MIPLTRFVEEFFGIGEVERRGVTGVGRHWRWPGVLKLEFGFWLVETYGGGISLQGKAFNAEIGSTPHLVKNHLGIGCLHDFSNGGF